MFKPPTKSLQCQEEGLDAHAEGNGSSAYMCTRYLQDQSFRSKQAELGEGLGRTEDTLVATTRTSRASVVLCMREDPGGLRYSLGICVRSYIKYGVLGKHSLPSKSANPRPVPQKDLNS